MFTALVVLMLAAIALSFIRREIQRRNAPAPVPTRTSRAAVPQQKPISRVVAILLFVAGGSLCLVLALAMDKRVAYKPAEEADRVAAPPSPPKSEPGPGWKVEHGPTLPPSGFTGHTAVGSEQGLAAKGYVVVGNGLFKRVGWRITGADAAYCSLDVELLARSEHRKLDSDGYAYTDLVLDEGWHEAKVQAWCPPDHASARFGVALMSVDANGRPQGNGSWDEAGDDDIRHR